MPRNSGDMPADSYDAAVARGGAQGTAAATAHAAERGATRIDRVPGAGGAGDGPTGDSPTGDEPTGDEPTGGGQAVVEATGIEHGRAAAPVPHCRP